MKPPTTAAVRVAATDDEIRGCFSVMAELRPHLQADEFIARIRRQEQEGYQMAFLKSRGRVVSVAGYRILECLMWGRFMYVDDLVTWSSARSRGWGQKLFAWLLAEARREGCAEFHLDSGVHRYGAHRFYLGQRLDITCHHFALKL